MRLECNILLIKKSAFCNTYKRILQQVLFIIAKDVLQESITISCFYT